MAITKDVCDERWKSDNDHPANGDFSKEFPVMVAGSPFSSKVSAKAQKVVPQQRQAYYGNDLKGTRNTLFSTNNKGF